MPASVALRILLIVTLLPAIAAFGASSPAMASLHGRTTLIARRGVSASGINNLGERPPDPTTLLSTSELEKKASILLDWWEGRKNVFCVTGAGLSTESGIPDYRGNNGSYHRGHKPMIHQQYMESEFQRKRYWGRSMVGWKGFDLAKPNVRGVRLIGWLFTVFVGDSCSCDTFSALHFQSSSQDMSL